MEYMGDSAWWNRRFERRDWKLMSHETCLEQDIHYFSGKKRILDVACGDGRNAIYLARMGYHVTCVDFSEEALQRLNYFAGKERLAITTKLADLSEELNFLQAERYDAIVINHYRLSPQLYPKLMSFLGENGILWVNGFREVPADNPDITEEDILKDDDFRTIDSYTLKDKNAYEVGQRKFVRYIWRSDCGRGFIAK